MGAAVPCPQSCQADSEQGHGFKLQADSRSWPLRQSAGVLEVVRPVDYSYKLMSLAAVVSGIRLLANPAFGWLQRLSPCWLQPRESTTKPFINPETASRGR